MDIEKLMPYLALGIGLLSHLTQAFDRQRSRREKELSQDIVIQMEITIDPSMKTQPIVNVLAKHQKRTN